jgi:hypothetical protein
VSNADLLVATVLVLMALSPRIRVVVMYLAAAAAVLAGVGVVTRLDIGIDIDGRNLIRVYGG